MSRLLSALIAASISVSTAHASEVTGEWWTPGFNARVRIEPCGDAWCGQIVWAWDDQPQGIADSRPLVGQIVISGMKLASPGRWTGGRLYNPEDGRSFSGSMTLKGAKNLVLEGCVLIFCQKQVWRREEPGVCPPVSKSVE